MDTLTALAWLKDQARYKKLARYRPYGHPDTLGPTPGNPEGGKLWQKMHAKGEWQEWSNKPWQLDFHNAGKDNPYRLAMAANGPGKTELVCAETAIHLTGLYPDWWEGKRFDRPVKVWAGSISNSTQKDAVQPGLLGPDLDEKDGGGLGSGYIPKESLAGKPKIRQAGIADVVDTVRVNHVSGGTSYLAFKVYQMGWRAWQAGAPDIVMLDEQPNELSAEEKGIFSEIQTRLFRSGGIFMAALTPLIGETPMISQFIKPDADGFWWVGATWDDAPHLKDDEKERLKAAYPPHEVDARTTGVPMRGEGAVWPISENTITCEPFQIPHHYVRIKGIDFGIGHPFGGADIAWDRDADIIYVIRTTRIKAVGDEAPVATHAAWLNGVDPWVPIAWPHDGTQREKTSGKQVQRSYRDAPYKCNLLGKSARYPKGPGEDKEREGAQPVEPIVAELYERMLTGRFKVFRGCAEFFDEFRRYHRKDGRIVAVDDDTLKAVMYAVIMKRYGVSRQSVTANTASKASNARPIYSARIAG